MSEEHITTTTSPDGNTSHTTVSSSGGGAGWLFGLIAVALLGFAVYYFANVLRGVAHVLGRSGNCVVLPGRTVRLHGKIVNGKAQQRDGNEAEQPSGTAAAA